MGVQINEAKEETVAEGKASNITTSDYGHPIKTKKHNIIT
jgi:hypothetical protein